MTLPDTEFSRSDLATKLATATVQVVFAYKNSPTDWDLQRLPLHGELQEAFRARFEQAAIHLRDDRAPRDYDPEWDLRPDEFFRLANEPPAGGDLFPQLATFATLPEYQPRTRERNPNAWIIVAQLDDDTLAYLGTRITASAVLHANSRALRVVYRDQAFDTLDETVISFRPDSDWIAWNGAMAVLNATNFHALFRDIPALLQRVDENLGVVTKHVGIANLDELAARIKATPAMAVKLSRIIERADMHTKGPAVLRKYGEDYGIDVDWQDDEMVFDGSVEKQWNILRLLDEARTLGPVTGKHWEASTKVEV